MRPNPAVCYKAKNKLGWTPEITLEQMIGEMVDADMARHKKAGA